MRERHPRLTAPAAHETSFARATTERSVAGVPAEGMAPLLGGHDAPESLGTKAQARRPDDNADRSGSFARRRIESSCGCARASQRTAEVGCSGLLAPIEASLEKQTSPPQGGDTRDVGRG